MLVYEMWIFVQLCVYKHSQLHSNKWPEPNLKFKLIDNFNLEFHIIYNIIMIHFFMSNKNNTNECRTWYYTYVTLKIEEYSTFRWGHRRMPFRRHIFLRTVGQIPSSLAAAFMGKWKCCAKSVIFSFPVLSLCISMESEWN